VVVVVVVVERGWCSRSPRVGGDGLVAGSPRSGRVIGESASAGVSVGWVEERADLGCGDRAGGCCVL
jgi:hypothetical protein